MDDLLRKIPQISKILNHFKGRYPSEIVKRAGREIAERYRKEVKEGKRSTVEDIYRDVERRIRDLLRTNLRRVINATGVVVNTNLGRAPLHPEVVSFIEEIASGYSNLEYNLAEGKRSRREAHVERYLQELTGAESALVVNNNADIMRSAGVFLKEVGTTNRTRLSDYEEAVSENTALLLKIHRSNFYMEGFTEEVPLRELAELSRRSGIPLYHDCGSGMLRDIGLNGRETTFRRSVSEGADLVSGSADKLLGGPQAGVVVGRRDLIDRIKRNPLMRILRVDKLTLAGLEATLKLYAEGKRSRREAHVERYLQELTGAESALVVNNNAVRDISRPGGGAFPELELPTYCVALKHRKLNAEQLSVRLRLSDPPVIGRVKRDLLLLDLRTVAEEELKLIPLSLNRALGESPQED